MATCTAPAALAPDGGSGSGTSWKKPAAPVASAAATNGGGQSWALLYPTIILNEEDHQDPAADSSEVTTSNGCKVHVSVRLAEPPASSYVKLRTDADVHVKPVLLAADGDMLLMRMVVVRVRDPPFTWYEDNYFVYQACPAPDSGKEGRLRLLPDPQQSMDDRDGYVGHVGIACSSSSGGGGMDDDWVVAGFHTRVKFGGQGVDDDEEGILSRFRSSSNEWDKQRVLSIPFNKENGKKGLYKFVWHTDDMVAHNRLMFWIDYHRGMIYCDVFADSPKLHYIRLPGIDIWGQDHDYSKGRQLPRAYRKVGVSEGQLKFINIDKGLSGTERTSSFKITTWSLKKIDNDLEWVTDHVLEDGDLWSSLPHFRKSRLPRWVPEYPVVDKKDASILHFILGRPQSDAEAWIITIDMSSKALKSYNKPFKNVLKLVFEDPSVDTTRIFCDTPFISCDFKPTGSCAVTSEVKCETTLLSTSKSKKRKPPSPAESNLELSDTPDSNITISDLRKNITRQRRSAAWLEDPSGTSLMPSCLHRHVTKTRKVEEVSTQSQGKQSMRPQRRLKKRSNIWDHFTRFTAEDGKEMAKCKGCDREYAWYGTSILWNHLARSIRDVPSQTKHMICHHIQNT